MNKISLEEVIKECFQHRKDQKLKRYNYNIKAKHGRFQVSGIGNIRVFYVNPTNGHCIFRIDDEYTGKIYIFPGNFRY